MPNEARNERVIARYVDSKGMCVFACENIESGQIIGYYEGKEVSANTMHSVHVEGKIIDGIGILRNLAHSCQPNAYFKDKRCWLYALKDIGAGTEVTIDYLDTEPVISEQFSCKCGSLQCRGVIRSPDIPQTQLTGTLRRKLAAEVQAAP